LVAAFALLQAPLVLAQGSSPREPAATEPLVLPDHASAFKTYRPYRDEERPAWREVNDEVGRVGGHIGVLKADAQDATPAPSPAPAAPASAQRPMPREGGHGHGRH
jgi:hypothetical protein